MSDLRLVDIARFVAIAEAYEEGKASTYSAVAEYVEIHYPTLADIWSCCSRTGKGNHIRNCWQAVQEHLQYEEALVRKYDNNSTRLTEAGRMARMWAVRAINCLSKNEPPSPSPERIYFALATHHIFEWTAIPNILSTFLADEKAKCVDVRIRQVQNILEGINLLRDDEVHAVLDAVDNSLTFPGIDRRPLDFSLSPVALIPQKRSTKNIATRSIKVSVQQLAEMPLAYVHMPEEIGHYVMNLSPEAPRVRVSTMAAVVKLVEQCGYAGLAVNWKTLLGPGTGKMFQAHRLKSIRRQDELALFTRKDLKERAQCTVVECFHRHLVSFVNGKAGRSQLI